MRWTRRAGLWAMTATVASISIQGFAADRPLSPARELARQLNQAFIEVADEVSPAVVVIDVAQAEDDTDQSEITRHPWFELLPEELREPFRRDRGEPNDRSVPEFNGQGSGMIIDQQGRVLTD